MLRRIHRVRTQLWLRVHEGAGMEVEIKARCFESAFPGIRNKLLSMGAEKVGEKRQLDQYYNPPHADFRGTKKYIRLRKDSDKAVFAYHENLERGLTRELESSVGNVVAFEQLLESLGFTKLGLIDKRREEFKLGDFSVCLDVVKGIGAFIEIETESDQSNWEQKHSQCIDLLKRIGLDEYSLTDEFLCDIATNSPSFSTTPGCSST